MRESLRENTTSRGRPIRTQTHIDDTKAPRPARQEGAARAKRRFAKPPSSRATAPRSVKAAPVAIKAKSSIDHAIAKVVASCLAHWQANLGAAVDGRDPEGIHQVRVGLRRFRSALSLFKDFVPPNQRGALNQEAKWLANQLGPVRDLDVFLADLAARVDEHDEDESLAALIRAAEAARADAQATAISALKSARMRRFAARLETWLNGRGWQDGGDDAADLPDFARGTLNRRLRKIKETAAKAEDLTVPERHELRIAVKKIRYSLEFLAAVLPPKKAARTASVLKNLQDSLGHLNDLDVAERTITLIAAGAPPSARRRMKKAGDTLKASHKKAAAKSEPETERLCHKLVKLPAF